MTAIPTTLPDPPPDQNPPDVLVVLLPLLLVLSTLLFLLLLFLISVLFLRRRRGISLRDNDGPVDLSRDDFVQSDTALDIAESRWLDSIEEPVRREYNRAKEHQLQYPPNSLPTDITLSQFLSIQEKGVSAWSFEPDYETVNSLLVHARTEITFLPDPASSSCVQSNLPLPKLNEVYYWEVKMFDLPQTTTVSIGLSTKPYPAFRLPGHNRYSIAYDSRGDKSYNYPFTATSFGPELKEGDVLGVGYRPRSGTVFFTRNGRKMDDAFTGLSRWNLFPTIGADGPCSVHVNFGQAGFVFIEANVKKWGLAPSVGTLAPPPAYGSERGSILLDVGGGVRASNQGSNTSGSPSSPPSPSPRRSSHRLRRPKHTSWNAPAASSPLRASVAGPTPDTPPPPITPIDEESPQGGAGPSSGYISPTDIPYHTSRATNLPASPSDLIEESETVGSDARSSASSSSTTSLSRSPSPDGGVGARNPFTTLRRHHRSLTHAAASLSDDAGQELSIQVHQPPDSPQSPNPPTPNQRDIHLQALPSSFHRQEGDGGHDRDDEGIPFDRLPPHSAVSRRDPPAYSPLDANTYADGVHIDLPAEVIAAALEGHGVPNSAFGQGSSNERRRSSRR